MLEVTFTALMIMSYIQKNIIRYIGLVKIVFQKYHVVPISIKIQTNIPVISSILSWNRVN